LTKSRSISYFCEIHHVIDMHRNHNLSERKTDNIKFNLIYKKPVSHEIAWVLFSSLERETNDTRYIYGEAG